MPRILALSLVLALAACNGGVEFPAQTWISPLDRQTGVALDTTLRVHMGDARIPEGYGVPEMIRVTDLDDEVDGFVDGEVAIVDDELQFTPTGGWVADHRYAWIFDPVDDAPHGPEFEFPDATAGAMALFDTSAHLEVIGSGMDELDRPCLVFSRPIDASDDGELEITANNVPLEEAWLELLPEEQWQPLPDSFDVDVSCINTTTALSEGAVLEIRWNDLGPWRAELGTEDIDDTIVELAWGNY